MQEVVRVAAIRKRELAEERLHLRLGQRGAADDDAFSEASAARHAARRGLEHAARRVLVASESVLFAVHLAAGVKHAEPDARRVLLAAQTQRELRSSSYRKREHAPR